MTRYAVEKEWTYGTKNRVWVEGAAVAELSSAMPGIWNQHKDWLQVEGAFVA